MHELTALDGWKIAAAFAVLHAVVGLWIAMLWFFKRPLYETVWANAPNVRTYMYFFAGITTAALYFDLLGLRENGERVYVLPLMYLLAYTMGGILFIITLIVSLGKHYRKTIPDYKKDKE